MGRGVDFSVILLILGGYIVGIDILESIVERYFFLKDKSVNIFGNKGFREGIVFFVLNLIRRILDV